MPTGSTRIVINFIIAFLVLALSFPLVTRAVVVGLNDYVVPSVVSNDSIDQAYNASIQVCAQLDNVTPAYCESWLSNLTWGDVHPFSRDAYYVQDSVFFPLTGSWSALLQSQYLIILILVALVFAFINEMGGST